MGNVGRHEPTKWEIESLEAGLSQYSCMVSDWVRMSLGSKNSPESKREFRDLGERIDSLDLDMTRTYSMIRNGMALVSGNPGQLGYDLHAQYVEEAVLEVFHASQIVKGIASPLILAMQVMIQQMSDFAKNPVVESDALMYMASEVLSLVDAHAEMKISKREREACVNYFGCCVAQEKILLPKSYASIVMAHHYATVRSGYQDLSNIK